MKQNRESVYPLSALIDPTDKQLSELMSTVARNVAEKGETARHSFIREINDNAERTFNKWKARIKRLESKQGA